MVTIVPRLSVVTGTKVLKQTNVLNVSFSVSSGKSTDIEQSTDAAVWQLASSLPIFESQILYLQ